MNVKKRTPKLALSKSSCGLLLALLLATPAGASTVDGWQESRYFLNSVKAPEEAHHRSLMGTSYRLMVLSLNNSDQHRRILEIHKSTGTSVYDARDPSRSLIAGVSQPSKNLEIELGRSLSKQIGQELQSTYLPQDIMNGVSFEIGPNTAQSTPSATRRARYGLLIKELEPNPEAFRMASVRYDNEEDYHLVGYAPKAKIHYEIGQLPAEDELPFRRAPSANTLPPKVDKLSSLLQFTGRLRALGPAKPQQPIPALAFTLDQSAGFYSFELRTSKFTKKDSLFHRLRLPIAYGMILRTECDQHLRRTRSTLENLYQRGPMTINIDHLNKDRKIQAGLNYQTSNRKFELVGQIADYRSSHVSTRPQERWELRLNSSF